MNSRLSPCRALILAVLGLAFVLPESAHAQRESISNIRVQALRAAASKLSIYELSFVANDTLAAEAEIVVEFPPAFNLDQLEIAGSAEMNGGVSVSRDHQTVHLERSGQGRTVLPGEAVHVRLAAILCPADLSTSYDIRVQVRKSARAELSAIHHQKVDFDTGGQIKKK